MFIIKTAFKYAFSKSGGRRHSAIMQILGIGAGIIALMIVSAVMNGLQTSQLRHLRNIESYDLTVVTNKLSISDLKAIDESCSVYETCETAVLIVDKSSGKSATARVRGISYPLLTDDRFSESLSFYTDYEELDNLASVSFFMLNSLGIRFEDNIELTFLRPGKTATIVPFTTESGIGGVYGSSISNYSSSTILMSTETLLSINPKTQIIYAVYTDMSTSSFAEAVKALDPEAKTVTWQEYNKALYSALTLEKTVMYVFMLFMFLILCVNLRNTTRRLIKVKQTEGAMLRALGCRSRDLNLIYIFQAMIICVCGEIFGVIIGYLAVSNIQLILIIVDKIIYLFTKQPTILTAIPFKAVIGLKEILLICTCVLLLTYILVQAACRKTIRKDIMEVIANVPD